MNIVYIATSLDGYIADSKGKIDWLPKDQVEIDNSFETFMNRVDALVMGKNTFETVCSFDVDWPYIKPVFVVSSSLKKLPEKYQDKVSLIQGTPKEIIQKLNFKGYNQLYIDGGKTIQNFLKADLIHEMIITTIPVLLGGGIPLFGELSKFTYFKAIHTKIIGNRVETQYQKMIGE